MISGRRVVLGALLDQADAALCIVNPTAPLVKADGEGATTKIEWTATHLPDGRVLPGYTFNPWTGCTKVSPGCDHCYAEGWSKRSWHVEWGPHGARRRTSAANWRLPIKWNAEAEASGIRRKVFCASLADVFDNHRSILPEWRADLWAMIAATPHLDWLMLTKRPQNIGNMLPVPFDFERQYPNVWLGTTVENQTEADRRIPQLLNIPAAVRFLSVEPMLGPMDLAPWLAPDKFCERCDDGEGYGNRCGRSDIPRSEQCPWTMAFQVCTDHGPFAADGQPAAVTCDVRTLDWVICGGESGPGARPMHPDWARSLRDQCNAARVPFFMKQMGGVRKPFAPIPDDLMVREFPNG